MEMDASIKAPNYTRYAADFVSACNGPSSPTYSHPPPQYTPRDSYTRSQAVDTAKQTEYYSTRPRYAQSANSTRQDEYYHYRTSPNFYHNRDPPCPAPAVDRNASIGTQNEYRCYQSNPDFYHRRRDDSNIASTAAQGVPGMQAPTATENKLGQVAQQRDFYQQRGFYNGRPPQALPRGSGQWGYSESFMQQTGTTAMRDAYYNRRPDQGSLRK